MSRPDDLGDVKHFIDITGASGSVYRFQRIADPAQLPARAGNFLFSRPSGDQQQVICCGTALRLVRAAASWKEAVEQHQATTIYVRLNVSRTARTTEHDDIVESQKPTMAMIDLDEA